eukprot:290151_1
MNNTIFVASKTRMCFVIAPTACPFFAIKPKQRKKSPQSNRSTKNKGAGAIIKTTLRSGDLSGFEELLEFGANVRTYSDPKLRYRLLHIICIVYWNKQARFDSGWNKDEKKQLNKMVDKLIALKCPLDMSRS